jgi:hypothetical protein
MKIDRACYERGCACYDDRTDKDPVEVVKREWVGLTDEEVIEFEKWLDFKEEGSGWVPPQKIVAYIEAKLKEKNG